MSEVTLYTKSFINFYLESISNYVEEYIVKHNKAPEFDTFIEEFRITNLEISLEYFINEINVHMSSEFETFFVNHLENRFNRLCNSYMDYYVREVWRTRREVAK